MPHPLWYIKNMIMKKATNLIIGAIYINGVTSNPCRLVHIVSCQGVYLETYDGQGYGDLVKFEDVFYADMDEVEDYLADSRVYDASNKAPSHKDEIVHRGFLQEDDETYFGCDTITAPDGNDYPIFGE